MRTTTIPTTLNPAEVRSIRPRREALQLTRMQVVGDTSVSLTFLASVECGYVPSHSEAVERVLKYLAEAEAAEALAEAPAEPTS